VIVADDTYEQLQARINAGLEDYARRILATVSTFGSHSRDVLNPSVISPPRRTS
jgi:hypothetical protein